MAAPRLSGLQGMDPLSKTVSSALGERPESPAASKENEFEALLRRIVSETHTPAERKEASRIAIKKIDALMDASILDIMDESPDSAPDEIEVAGPAMTWSPSVTPHDTPAPEASKKQQVEKAYGPPVARTDFDAIIDKASTVHGVDAGLIRSVIKTESGFKPGSTSPRGAMGLMQLMPGTARDMGVSNAYDPYENIMGGTKYLKKMLDRYHGDTAKALAAYNWGPGNVDKNPDRMPEETRNYISRVTGHYRDARA